MSKARDEAARAIRANDPHSARDASDPLWSRSRGLDELERRFGGTPVQDHVRDGQRAGFRALELGFGRGRVLLELMDRFGIETHGVARKERHMSKKADLVRAARDFGIRTKTYPTPHFYDMEPGLRFDDDAFDLVVSQVALHYIGNKARVIEEVWRVLRPGGRAFLHLDGVLDQAYPDFMRLCSDLPRFVIYSRGRIISTARFVDGLRRKNGHDIRLKRTPNQGAGYVLRMHKNMPGLDLGLTFDGASTLDLGKLKYADEHKFDGRVWWGTRSVFNR